MPAVQTPWSAPDAAWAAEPPAPEPTPPVRVGSSPWVHLLLLLLTFATMTWAGSSFFLNYVSAVNTRALPRGLTAGHALIGGLWFSVPALLILAAHEMGHYVACRYYRIPATLPYFIPGPTLVGTFGAVIRMAVPTTRRALFDVGIAGPIAGFVVLVPFAVFGMLQSYSVRLPRGYPLQGLNLGDPLLITQLQRLIVPSPATDLFVMHPAGFAAWFGLMATVLNLFPAGQLDGGHIVHALFGRASRYVTIATILILLTLGVTVSSTWLFWGVLITMMSYMVGLEHPPVSDEHVPIGGSRMALGLVAVLIFVLSFTPVPISPIELVGGR